jgi:hypothetical protein
LFFVDADRRLVAAEVEADSEFRVLQRVTLFTFWSAYVLGEGIDFYDIADDGRFLHAPRRLTTSGSGDDDGSTFIIVLNWFEELRQRLGN